MSAEVRFPRFTVAGALALPALLILTGHPVLGAATLAGVLAAWVAHTRMVVRAGDGRRPDASRAPATVGGHPAPVVRELRPRVPEARDDRDPAYPDEEGWVHLRPSDW